MCSLPTYFFFFFFNDTATTEIYTLSLHDALPISGVGLLHEVPVLGIEDVLRAEFLVHPVVHDPGRRVVPEEVDRKSTRLNSSHLGISYAVFCLKKKKKIKIITNVTESY